MTSCAHAKRGGLRAARCSYVSSLLSSKKNCRVLVDGNVVKLLGTYLPLFLTSGRVLIGLCVVGCAAQGEAGTIGA